VALTAYRNLGGREFHDLDLLVHPEDVARAKDVLMSEGYALWSPVVGNKAEDLLFSKERQLCFTNNAHGTAVDLHWGLMHAMFSFQLDVNQVFDAARMERYDEAEFLSLSPEHTLVYLCAHGTKQCWSSLSQLCDVAMHIQSKEKMDWNRCFEWAEAGGCSLLLKHTLLLCERVLGVDLPWPVRQSCWQDETALALSKTAENFLCLEGERRPGYLRALKYHLAFAATWRSRGRLVVTRIFAPTEPDWHRVRLPRNLFGLYYFLRPLRFFLEQRSKLMRSR
jgi:hypothetical protein